MGALLKRDLLLAYRRPLAWVLGPVFFAVFIALFVIATGPEASDVQILAGPVIWLASLFGLLLSFPRVFSEDFADGTLDALKLSGESIWSITIAKALAFFCTSIVPILVMVPIAGLLLAIPNKDLAGILLSLLIACPAFIAYGLMTGAILGRTRGAGFLSVILAGPFLIPPLIFGMAAIDTYPEHGINSTEFQALFGLSLIAVAIAVPATVAALNSNVE